MARLSKIKDPKTCKWIDVPVLKRTNPYNNKFYYELWIRERDGENAGKWIKEDRWIRPIKIQQTLDNSLDIGAFTIWMTERKEVYKPFTPIRFEIYEWRETGEREVDRLALEGSNVGMTDTEIKAFSQRAETLIGKTAKIKDYEKVLVDKIYMYISSDTVTQKAFAQPDRVEDVGDRSKYKGIDLYNHDIELIELTKELERVGNDTLSFTRYLGHVYSADTKGFATWDLTGYYYDRKDDLIYYNQFIENEANKCDESYKTPYDKNASIKIKSYDEVVNLIVWENYMYNGQLKIGSLTIEDAIIEIFNDNINIATFDKTGGNFIFSDAGNYHIKYTFKTHYWAKKTEFTSEVNEYHDNGFIVSFLIQIQKTINPKKDFNIYDACKRALSIIPMRRDGIEEQKYKIHGNWINRLENITLSELFVPQKTLYETLALLVANCQLIPRLIWDEKSDKAKIITFDEIGGSKRRNIKAKTTFYTATLSIDRYCNMLDSIASNIINTKNKNGTITDEFSTRCETGEIIINDDNAIIMTNYPIYQIENLECTYNSVTKDITGFVYEKAEYDSVLNNVDINLLTSKAYAIYYEHGTNNIYGLSHKISTGVSEIAIKNIWHRLTNSQINDGDVNKLQFKITYKAINETRTQQKKIRIEENELDNSIIFNQTESVVETFAYGENMKGTIARMGLQVEEYTYYFYKYDDLPKIGELVEDKYVVSVASEPELNWIKASVTYTRDYNMLMEYMGLNSNLREFDISEKQAYERHVLYNEDIIIGDEISIKNNKTIMTDKGIELFANTFLHDNSIPILFVYAKGLGNERDINGDIVTKNLTLNGIIHSVSAMALGNSIQFNFSYNDNFSAGYRSVSGSTGYRVQEAVKYCDEQGEIDKLKINYYNDVPINYYNYPLLENAPQKKELINIDTHPLLISKDSREYLNICVSLTLRTNRDDIILGTGLTQNNALIKRYSNTLEKEDKPCLYLLTYKLNNLNSIIDESRAKKIDKFNIKDYTLITKEKIVIKEITNTLDFEIKSWAIACLSDNRLYSEILIGQNINLASGESSQKIFINFIDNKNKKELLK